MALENREFIALAPDGAGKRLAVGHVLVLGYQSRSGAINVGDDLLGATSGVQGVVVGIEPTNELTGRVTVILNQDFDQAYYTVGENLTVQGSVVATAADAGEDLYLSQTLIIGGNNPANRQYVDNEGSAYVRFSDGSPAFDAYGKTKVATPIQVGSYPLTYDEDATNFATMLTGGGTSVYNSARAGVVLATDTISGSRAVRRSHRYHKMSPGLGASIKIGLALGDAGKSGVTRTWGAFDDDNGVIFTLRGTTLSVGHRTSTSGTMVEHLVPQSLWNGDRLDGNNGERNKSGVQLDLTKINIWWVDYQWLGAGRMAFGIFGAGSEKIVCHVMEHNNDSVNPFLRNGSLPLAWEVVNTASTASASEMSVYASNFDVEGGVFAPRSQNIFYAVSNKAVTDAFAPVASWRPGLTFRGRRNNATAVFTGMEFDAFSGVNFDVPESVEIQVLQNATLTGAVWGAANAAFSAFEVDTSATTATGGLEYARFIVRGNMDKVFTEDSAQSYLTGGLSLQADGAQPTLTLMVRALHPGRAATFSSATSWNEIRD